MVNIVVLVNAIEQKSDGSCCCAADTWTQDVVHAAAVSDAIRLYGHIFVYQALGRPSTYKLPRVQFGEGLSLLWDTNLVKHALQLHDRKWLLPGNLPHTQALEDTQPFPA